MFKPGVKRVMKECSIDEATKSKARINLLTKKLQFDVSKLQKGEMHHYEDYYKTKLDINNYYKELARKKWRILASKNSMIQNSSWCTTMKITRTKANSQASCK